MALRFECVLYKGSLMLRELVIGSQVELVAFNGKPHARNTSNRSENYWLLIGTQGIVVNDVPIKGIKEDRVLILFDAHLDELGLISHNEITNTLWIERSDLKVIE